MHLKEALDFLAEKARSSATLDVKNSLETLYYVITRSGLDDSKQWSDNIEEVAAYVEAGNYVYNDQKAKKLLNQKNITYMKVGRSLMIILCSIDKNNRIKHK